MWRVRQRTLEFVGDPDLPLRRGYVLLSSNGKPYSPVMCAGLFRRTMVEAGLVGDDGKPLFTLHALRHASASLMIEHGLPPLNVKQFMGHENIQTTFDIYGHLFDDDTRTAQAVQAVADILSPDGFGATRARQEAITG